MSAFDWGSATQSLESFGGREKTLRVPKTGLAFFDVLRLYGAIEMYLGLSGEITITDAGHEWQAKGKARDARLKSATDAATVLNKGAKLSKNQIKAITNLLLAIEGNTAWPVEETRNLSTPLDNTDSTLKDGVRDHAALRYVGLATGEGRKSKIGFVDALLAFASQERIQKVRKYNRKAKEEICFIPVFEGLVDFSKVISPLRITERPINALWAQGLVLLSLQTSLFAEGFADKLSAVVFNTDFDSQSNYNFSGLISIRSTAIGRRDNNGQFILPKKCVSHLHHVFLCLVRSVTSINAKPYFTEDAFAYAYWLMQPERPQHLGSLLTAVERQVRDGREHLLLARKRGESEFQTYTKEIFDMTYNNWNGDHQAVRKLARAVASGIWVARQKKQNTNADKGKAWYDEVTMLRSAPTAKAFFERALILIEQGHRENSFIGTAANDENFDVAALQESIGKDRRAFETFRDLFRMYLIQESTPRTVSHTDDNSDSSGDDSPTEGDAPSEQEGEL